MAEQQEKVFASGVFIEEKTFDWGSIIKQSYKVDDFIKFLNENKNAKGYVNLDVKKSKAGDKMYAEVNSYQPKETADSGLPF